MSTLAHRALPWQRQLMRVVAGQIKTAKDGHPSWTVSDSAIRSLTKRIAGHVAAEWPRLSAVRQRDLAASVPAVEGAADMSSPSRRAAANLRRRLSGRDFLNVLNTGDAPSKGRVARTTPHLLKNRIKNARAAIAAMAGQGRVAMHNAKDEHARLIFAARVEALADALRAIGKALD